MIRKVTQAHNRLKPSIELRGLKELTLITLFIKGNHIMIIDKFNPSNLHYVLLWIKIS